jgi:hypothetical protein
MTSDEAYKQSLNHNIKNNHNFNSSLTTTFNEATTTPREQAFQNINNLKTINYIPPHKKAKYLSQFTNKVMISSKSHGDITFPSQSTSFAVQLQIKTQQAKINQYYKYNESVSQQALIHLYTYASDTHQAEQAGNMLFRYLLFY